LTSQCRQFIEALLDTRPEVREILWVITGRDDAAGPPARVANLSHWGTEDDHGLPFGTVDSSATPSSVARMCSPLRSVTWTNDEQELKQWAETARVGQQKVLACGNDRQRHLYNVCDKLNLIMQLDGRRLAHESDWNDRS
jgi:hypothetical protein